MNAFLKFLSSSPHVSFIPGVLLFPSEFLLVPDRLKGHPVRLPRLFCLLPKRFLGETLVVLVSSAQMVVLASLFCVLFHHFIMLLS
jgi:hypothetical protein